MTRLYVVAPIVPLHAVCVSVCLGSFFLITELCCHGDLLAYLHRHKHSLLTDEVPHLDNR